MVMQIPFKLLLTIYYVSLIVPLCNIMYPFFNLNFFKLLKLNLSMSLSVSQEKNMNIMGFGDAGVSVIKQ